MPLGCSASQSTKAGGWSVRQIGAGTWLASSTPTRQIAAAASHVARRRATQESVERERREDDEAEADEDAEAGVDADRRRHGADHVRGHRHAVKRPRQRHDESDRHEQRGRDAEVAPRRLGEDGVTADQQHDSGKRQQDRRVPEEERRFAGSFERRTRVAVDELAQQRVRPGREEIGQDAGSVALERAHVVSDLGDGAGIEDARHQSGSERDRHRDHARGGQTECASPAWVADELDRSEDGAEHECEEPVVGVQVEGDCNTDTEECCRAKSPALPQLEQQVRRPPGRSTCGRGFRDLPRAWRTCTG